MTTRELTLDEALAELLAALPSPSPLTTEEIELAAAARRVLARDLVATLDLPSFDNAAMDGYAARASDCHPASKLAIIGRAPAGHVFEGEVGAQQAVRILTGAPMPAGTDAIVIDEQAAVTEQVLTIGDTIASGSNVRRRGEHVRRGDAVLARGRRLRASDLGLAASLGASRLPVYRSLRVGLLSTGDELADPPSLLTVGGAYDGNRPFLRALLERSGFTAIDLGIAGDTAAALGSALRTAETQALDVVITSGGAAQGDADFVRRHGDLRFIPVNFRPGRGIVAGSLRASAGNLPLFGLPGNSVAAYTMFALLVRPLLGQLCGAGLERSPMFHLPLAAPARGRPGRVEWRRARWTHIDGQLCVEPMQHQGSAMLRTVSEADALIAIGPQERHDVGTLVPAIPVQLFE